jgi:hypothetical protein
MPNAHAKEDWRKLPSPSPGFLGNSLAEKSWNAAGNR